MSPAERAAQIAAGLARLADLARDPRMENALLTFAGVLDTMRADADELAAVLAEAEGADENSNETVLEVRDEEPVAAAPLTFVALSRAVELLTHDAQTRIWPVQEATELPGMLAGAVATVQAATKALHAFFAAQMDAASKRGRLVRDESGRPAQEPEGLQVAFLAAQGALALADAFADMREREAGEPLARIVSGFSNVQRGVSDPLFVPVRKFATARQTNAARLIGLAASAMDAWQEADSTRDDASGRVAALFDGVRRRGGRTPAPITAKTVAYWRDKARSGELTPAEAQAPWQAYRARLAELPAGEAAGARRQRLERLAQVLEAQITRTLASHGPDFVLAGGGGRQDAPKPERKAPKIRVERPRNSNTSRG
ncbi:MULTISPECIES: hypothetical protein [Roseomonadaceae]|uniref:Uncharacterized protein n=1 Tax=Falsiroseomonas oleicola TaxID=2801474 RepID=A0ABS6HCA5_9PROT|nr:hypothetical protein [Roseomonas oleicola]MBU8546354.1 hypothetical protein [Roseomonas oleicola]